MRIPGIVGAVVCAVALGAAGGCESEGSGGAPAQDVAAATDPGGPGDAGGQVDPGAAADPGSQADPGSTPDPGAPADAGPTPDLAGPVPDGGLPSPDALAGPDDGWWTQYDEYELILKDAHLAIDEMTAANEGNPDTYAGDLSRLLPGARRLIAVTLANIGAEDHMWYPGVALAADHEGIEVDPPWMLYGIFAGQEVPIAMGVTLDESIAPGTTVTLTFSVMSLGCDNDPPQGCPPPAPLALTLEVGAP